MKKNKSKSGKQTLDKKTKKELELKLTTAFNEIAGQFGKTKKTDKVIGKFSKQLAKKLFLKTDDDSIAPFIKEEKTSDPKPVKQKAAKPADVKEVTKKPKAPVAAEVESK